MRQRRPKNRRAIRGFTLLELLIAVSLLGLIFAALTGGLRFGTQAWQTTAGRLSHNDDLQLVFRTLRRQISSSIMAPGNLIDARRQGSFEGLRDQISFVGAAPALAMPPGLYHLSLILVPEEVGQALALRWKRIDHQTTESGTDNVEPVIRGLQSVGFSYFGAPEPDEEARWRDEWRDTNIPPSLVRISFKFVDPDRLPWPDLIIPVATKG